jgi:hypothetical protein
VSARRVIAVLVALAAVAGGGAFLRHQGAATRERLEEALRASVVRAAADDAAAVEAEGRNAAARAAIAGSTDSLKRLALQWTNAETVRDLFASEAAWQSVRDEFDGSLLFVSPEQVAGSGTLEHADGIEALVPAARRQHALAQVRRVGAEARWVAASVVAVPAAPGQDLPVLVLAKRVSPALLARAAPDGAVALGLSDGRQALGSWGTGAERSRLGTLVGREGAAQSGLADGSWVAAAHDVEPGLWLWTAADTSGIPAAVAASVREAAAPVWGASGLLAVVALGLGFVGGKRAPVPAPPAGGLSKTFVSSPGVDPSPLATLGSATAPSAARPALPPTTLASDPSAAGGIPFGRYVLVDRLGQGGMGDVYVGVAHGAEGFKRTFVVKRLRPEFAQEKVVVAQFIEEARLGSTLVHSNIIPVFDFGKEGDEYFLTQEYILGRDLEKLTLRSWERDARPLPPWAAYYCVHHVLQALAFAHGKTDDAGVPLRLVHRDISPQNILISARGEVKLFDFGIVKSADRQNKTQEGVVKGNVTFMAPEQARGLEVDQRADLFSLGLVLARLLTGEVLYQAANTYDLMVRAATGLSEDHWAKIDELPAPAPALLRRALQTEPAERFQTAGAFAAALPPLRPSAQEELAALVERLVGDDLRAERERLAARGSGTVPRLAAVAPLIP